MRSPRVTVTVAWSYAFDGSDPRHFPARQIGNRPFLKGDVALLKVGAEHTIPLPISLAEVSIGVPIDSVGFPGLVDDVTDADKVNPSFKDGEISSKKTIEQGLQDVYEVSAAIAPGMSGGPTVDQQGRVNGLEVADLGSFQRHIRQRPAGRRFAAAPGRPRDPNRRHDDHGRGPRSRRSSRRDPDAGREVGSP